MDCSFVGWLIASTFMYMYLYTWSPKPFSTLPPFRHLNLQSMDCSFVGWLIASANVYQCLYVCCLQTLEGSLLGIGNTVRFLHSISPPVFRITSNVLLSFSGTHWIVQVEHLFGIFFAQSGARLGAALARGTVLRVFHTSFSAGHATWRNALAV